ncbi:MAG: glycosyltransferase family 2 protein [Nevskiaceae bacterium]
MNLADITPVILTLDEGPNLPRTLAALSWARQIVIVDSGSADGSLEPLRADPRVRIMTRAFDSFARQWSHALDHVRTPYTLTLDADYVLTPELSDEIAALDATSADGWTAEFIYCVDGHPLSASLLPPRLVLYRTGVVSYVEDGHAQREIAPPRVAALSGRILHDDRKPASRWRVAQARYAQQEADKLARCAWRDLSWPDRMRRLLLGPALVVPYCLFAKGLILDGRAGLAYTYQRFYAEALLWARLVFGS